MTDLARHLRDEFAYIEASRADARAAERAMLDRRLKRRKWTLNVVGVVGVGSMVGAVLCALMGIPWVFGPLVLAAVAAQTYLHLVGMGRAGRI